MFESARLALIVGGLLLAFPAWGQEHKLVPVQRPIAPFLQPDPRQGYLRQPNAEERGTQQAVKVVPTEGTPEAEQREKDKEERERRLADYTEALFYATAFLGLATFGLAVVAFFQMRDARGSIVATQRLAHAAETTMLHVERPYVFIADLAATYEIVEGTPNAESVKGIEFRYTIRNQGRTPAFVYEVNENVDFIQLGSDDEVIYAPPSQPRLGSGRMVVEIIGAGQKSQVRTCTFAPAYILGKHIPVFYGCISYRDMLGRKYESGFGFKWVNDHQFTPYTDDAYHYDRELKSTAATQDAHIAPENAV